MSLEPKPVYIRDLCIGYARTWEEIVAMVTSPRRPAPDVSELQRCGSEGPDGFWLAEAQKRGERT